MPATNNGSAPVAPATATPATTNAATSASPPTASSIGLSSTQQCTSSALVASVIASLVSERFAMTKPKASSLEKDLSTYFKHVGITNDEIFSFMVDPSSWPPATKLTRSGSNLSNINVPVTLLLSQLAKYCQYMLAENYYLAAGIKYDKCSAWIASLNKATPSSSTSPSSGSNQDKIPTFTVPEFRGDSLAGDKYMEDVVRAFTSNAMVQFLDDASFCTKNATWSGAFASRLRESIANSSILGFIATEEESESNCATLWSTIVRQLTSADLQMARAMAHWNELFSLKCNEKDSFLQFYSKAKSILFKLKRDKSVAVGDDIFLRAYFAKVIEAPELQTEVKKLISDKNGTYDSILELIHKDYRAQETGDALRDTPRDTLALRRAKQDTSPTPVHDKPPQPDDRPPKRMRFPSNENTLLPPHFYVQFKEWWEHMSVPKAERTALDISWMRNFKFDFSRPRSNRDGGFHSGSSGTSNRSYNRNDRTGRPNQDDRYHGRRDDDRRGRRVTYEDDRDAQLISSRDDDYDAFLAWKDSQIALRRAQINNDGASGANDVRRRRASMFSIP